MTNTSRNPTGTAMTQSRSRIHHGTEPRRGTGRRLDRGEIALSALPSTAGGIAIVRFAAGSAAAAAAPAPAPPAAATTGRAVPVGLATADATGTGRAAAANAAARSPTA